MNASMTNPAAARWGGIRHVLPFVIWIGIMTLPMPDVALRYALQVAASLVAFLVLRPWQYYPAFNIRTLPLGVMVGTGVAAIWILPETLWIQQFHGIHDVYVRYFILGSEPGNGRLYAPEQCGWLLASIKFLGSACVIAVIEEFFWRGFLMRWLVRLDFLSVDPRQITRGFIVIAAIVFGFEHSRWLVGIIAGLAYGALYCRKGDIVAVSVAHVTTNFLLGLYVLANGAYQFW